ncbi:DUF4188 domain-containing protein [Streptomyces sp. NPDC046716]|uniref:DUF4188 domain-containing protein n=1 Tax=Streptomyces sp. NPDC046716 TaxID=3157093 RepID=UPI0033C96615
MGRTTADAEGDVVVFLIGMRINRFWAVHHWLPVFCAMPMMLRELGRDRGLGLLHHVLLTASPRTYYVVQYWESKEKLLAYAAAPSRRHQPWWARMNRYARRSRGHVGLWHETYVVPAGSYETIYADMPPHGLARAHGVRPLGDGVQARDRLAV